MKSMALKKNTILGGDDVVANVGYSNKGLSEPSQAEKPEYPFCLRLSLGSEELKMLGIEKMPALKSEMELEAKVIVVGISTSEYGDRLELQITDMAIDDDADEEMSTEEKIYGANQED
jgi:hypothetical protein